MTQADYGAYAPSPQESSGGLGRVVNIVGAVSSVALVLGVGFWGYKLMVRDVMGVPVIQAMQGPMRIVPDDPEGQIATHTGLAVNRIAAEGVAGETADRITLAPGTVDLTEEDAPGLVGTANVVPQARPASLGAEDGIVASLAVVDPAAPTLATPDPQPELAVETPTMATSLRPRPRPTRAAAQQDDTVSVVTAAAAAAVAAALSDPAEAQTSAPAEPQTTYLSASIDTNALTEGARLAQLGAFDDEAGAIREWDRLVSANPDAFSGKARVIQPATSAGRTFYRLRVHGFGSEEASRSFCAQIEAPDLRCIPVIHR